jgi:archaellum component FlaG (FlaF/FlaG flagellin family)
MKTYRLITFVAAVLITVLMARFLSDGKISVSPDAMQASAAEAP